LERQSNGPGDQIINLKLDCSKKVITFCKPKLESRNLKNKEKGNYFSQRKWDLTNFKKEGLITLKQAR